MKRFSPFLSYLLWGTILVVSLAVDHHQADSAPVACVTPVLDSDMAGA